jgi:hypothetical protein
MRVRHLVLSALFTIALPVLVSAEVCPPRDQLQQYVKEKFPDCPKDLVLLAYEHPLPVPLQARGDAAPPDDKTLHGTPWFAARVNGPSSQPPGCALEKIDLETDLDGKPRLSLGSKDRLLAVVYNTNPMLYTVEPGKTEEADVEGVTELKQLAGLLGGNISNALRLIDRFQPPAEPSVAALVADAHTIRQSLSNILARKAAAQRANLVELDAKRRNLESLTSDLDVVTLEVRSYMRAVENRLKVERTINKIDRLTDLSRKIDDAGLELGKAKNAALESSCQTSYTAASGALLRKLAGFSQKDKPQEEADFAKDLRSLEDENLQVDRCDDEEQDALAELHDWLSTHSPADHPDKDPDLKALKSDIDGYLELIQKLATVKTQSAELLAKVSAAAKLAESLQGLATREARYISKDDQSVQKAPVCSLSAGIIEIFSGDPKVRILKFQKRKFTLKADAPLASDLERHHQDNLVDVGFELDSKWINDFSLGFGVVYHTDTVNPKWSAVADTRHPQPAGSTTPAPKYIGRTDEESLSGDPLLVLSYVPQQPERFLRWGVDVGGSLNTDHPGLLLGVSTSLGKFVRLGGGWSWTRVKELRPDQMELRYLANGDVDPASTVVTADTDIRQRDKYNGDLYFSLTFSLDALPFFKPAEKK